MRILKRRPIAEYRTFGQALAALAVVRAALVLLPLRSVRRAAWRMFPASSGGSTLPLHRVAACVSAAARISPVPSTCLANALVAEALLRRHGYRSRLRLGVRRDAGNFAAHAWLEVHGAIVIGGPASVVEQYTPFPGIEHLIS